MHRSYDHAITQHNQTSFLRDSQKIQNPDNLPPDNAGNGPASRIVVHPLFVHPARALFQAPTPTIERNVPPCSRSPWAQGQQQAGSSVAAAESAWHCAGNAGGACPHPTQLTHTSTFHLTPLQSSLCPLTQDDPQADVQPAYSYDPPGRNHLFVPGAFWLCCPPRVGVCSSSSIAHASPGIHAARPDWDSITQAPSNPKQLPSTPCQAHAQPLLALTQQLGLPLLPMQGPSTSMSACCVP